MANPKSTQMWFAKARQDLKTAKFLRPVEPDFFSGIVFHCQQCAEKSIKGFLTYNNVRVLKTHDMRRLLESLANINSDLATQYAGLNKFTAYAVDYRYPDSDLELEPLTEAIVKESVQLADSVYNELAALIPKD